MLSQKVWAVLLLFSKSSKLKHETVRSLQSSTNSSSINVPLNSQLWHLWQCTECKGKPQSCFNFSYRWWFGEYVHVVIYSHFKMQMSFDCYYGRALETFVSKPYNLVLVTRFVRIFNVNIFSHCTLSLLVESSFILLIQNLFVFTLLSLNCRVWSFDLPCLRGKLGP